MRFVVGAIVAMMLAGACRSTEAPTEPARPLKLKTVSLSMSAEANDNWPVPVELVRFEDAALADILLSKDAKNWFDGDGENFRRAHPEVRSDSWEVVPGTLVGPFEVRMRGKLAGVLFCGTRQAAAPLRVERKGDVVINIDDTGCTLTGGSPTKERSWLPW